MEPTEAPMEEPTEMPAEEPTEMRGAEEADTEMPAEEPTEMPAEEPTAMPAEEAAGMTGDPEIGAYLFSVARGCGCHFNRDLSAYAGGNKFELPDGVVYAANITPDPDTGIGSLSEQEIATILQTGAGPGGYQLHPIMPYHSFSALSDEDALDLAAYLLSQDPVVNEIPPRELTTDPAPFTPDPAPPAMSPTDPVARGEMLVSLARCGQCHTPRNEDGSPNMDNEPGGESDQRGRSRL